MFCHGCNRDLPIVKFPNPGCVCQECLEKIEHQRIERLRVTSQLTDKEYKKLLKYENDNDVELSAKEIAAMFKFEIIGS